MLSSRKIPRGGWRSRCLLFGAAMLVGAGLLWVPPGVAASGTGQAYEVYLVLTPVPKEELQDMRGGLRIAGLDLDFAAQVQVYVNNVKVATTQLVLNALGGIDSSTVFDNAPPGGLSVTPFLHDGPVGLNGMQGFAIADTGGARSFALHSIGLSHTTGAVVNTINGVAVKQMVDATLVINNFAAVQSNLLRQAMQRLAARTGVPDAVMGIGGN
jgi:hypothetical protein